MADEVTVEAIFDDGRAPREQRTVRLCWTATDPLAVLVEVAGMRRGPWVVARDALRAGLRQPTGIGAVRVGPVGDDVVLTLQADRFPHVVRVPAGRLRAFLDQTDSVVAPGSESYTDSLNAALDDLLDE